MSKPKYPIPAIGTVTEPVVLGAPGAGGVTIAYVVGCPVFVMHGIAGETVRVRITATKSKIAFGDVVDVVKPSPLRVEHIWPEAAAGGVGGAELGHVAYSAQTVWKSEVLNGTMRRLGRISDWRDIAVEQVEETGLGQRLRAEVIALGGGKIGMHRYRSSEIMEIHGLPLAHPALFPALVTFAERHNIPAGRRLRAVATAQGVRIVDFEGNRVTTMHGRQVSATVTYKVDDDIYEAEASGFWQPHLLGAATLRRAVEDFLDSSFVGSPARAVDLFCGSGLFTVALAKTGAEVLAVEADEVAVGHARRNCERLVSGCFASGAEGTNADGYGAEDDGVDDRVVEDPAVVVSGAGMSGSSNGSGTNYSGANVRVEAEHISAKRIFNICDGADLVIADPPRAGLGRDAIDAISACDSVRQVIYVACDYAALARDLGYARELGWDIAAARAFDLFPHTHHVETVALLSKLDVDKHIDVEIKLDELDLTSAESKATYA